MVIPTPSEVRIELDIVGKERDVATEVMTSCVPVHIDTRTVRRASGMYNHALYMTGYLPNMVIIYVR